MLHAINFFRQDDNTGADLYLNVHDRLLSAVSSNHGYAFQRILDALDLPIGRIVLLLPTVTAQQGWLLSYVADNYRRNGFRFAVNAASAREGLHLLERVRPDVIRLDARGLVDEQGLAGLLERAAQAGVRVVFKRVETPEALLALQRIGAASGRALLAQGFLLDVPRTALLNAGEALAAAA
jgi:EAL domain-containing protein (putative c-di-GMP-specific phosphodiesterase class I)